MTMRSHAVLVCLSELLAGPLSPVGAGSPLSNDPTPLAVCQDTIRTAGLRLGSDARRALSACFTAGIECVAGDAATAAACCERAAVRCRSRLATLERATARFARFVQNRRCADVPFADVLAADGLGYAALADVCGALAPRASVDDLAALSECLARVVVRGTACTLATRELPRSADALVCMGIDSIDLVGCTDGSSAPTPTPTPTPSGTPAPTRTVSTTGTPTATATAAPTATPSAIVTGTRTPTPVSATQTATPVATVTGTQAPTPTTTTVPPTATPVATSTRTATPVFTVTGTQAPTPTTTTVPPTATSVPTSTRTATPVATVTGTQAPTPTATSTPAGPVCGNGVIESGELCDDGNTINCDECPKNCLANTAPVACSATTVRHAQRVRLQAPAGAFLSGGQICLDYPSGVVSLPGTGNVAGRTSNLSGLVTLNDFNNAVQLTFVASANVAQVNPTISFDLCTGQTAPLPSAFQCVVKGASNQGTAIDPSLVECTPVTIP